MSISKPARYRKKPVVVEAMQWAGGNEAEIQAWAGTENFAALNPEIRTPRCRPTAFATAEVRVAANGNTWLPIIAREWVLRDELGFYPCKDQQFPKIYEPVDE